jgi:hypothetical protein
MVGDVWWKVDEEEAQGLYGWKAIWKSKGSVRMEEQT